MTQLTAERLVAVGCACCALSGLGLVTAVAMERLSATDLLLICLVLSFAVMLSGVVMLEDR